MRSLFLVPLCLLVAHLEADVIISEFLASNDSIIQDDDLEYSDYIELFNTGGDAVSLDGYYLTDKADNLTKWRIPAVNLSAGQRLLIYASGKDKTNPVGTLHTNFSLAKGGEYLGLIGPDGVTVISDFFPVFSEQFEDVSYGILDGDVEVLAFLVPSPGEPNTERYINVQKPAFSPAHGFYEDPFTLNLFSELPEAKIYYTLDGSKPTVTSGTLYDPATGIQIDDTRVVRAIAVLTGYPVSPVATSSYIFLESVVNQSNNQTDRGFPAMWVITRSDYSGTGKSRIADYEMDPEIEIQPSDLTTVPSISIVLPQVDLWDGYSGIYVNSHKDAGSDDFWERECSIEYIDPSSDVTFSADGGLRIFGGAASHPNLSDKMGFRVIFRGEYGVGRLDTEMFERVGSNANTINTIVLRSHWGKSYLRNPDINNWAGEHEPWEAVYMRDVYTNETYRATGHLNSRSMMVHLYLNGLYFGLFEAMERPDDSFNSENRDGEDEDYDVIKGDSGYTYQNGRLHSGSFEAYKRLTSFFDTKSDGSNLNPSTPHAITDEELEIIAQYLDLEAFCDYMISLWFLNRLDFPNKNWYAAAKRGEPGGPPEQPFLFFTWDSEATLFFDDSFNRKISFDERSVAERWNLSSSHDFGPVRFYRRLKLNEKFRQLWADRVYELMFNDGPLSRENNLVRWGGLAAELDRAIIGESARWGDWVPSYRYNPITRDDWLQEVEMIRDHILDGRNDLTIEQMREFGVYPDLDPPVIMNAGGIVWPDEGVQLARTGNEGVIKYTTDGSDPRESGVAYDVPFTVDGPVRLRTALLVGSEWSAAAEERLMPLGGLPLAITEVMYRPGPTLGIAPGDEGDLEYLEITNVGTKPVSLGDVALTDGVDFDFNTGSITGLAPGESLIVVKDAGLFAQAYGASRPVAGEYEGSLDNGGERIELSVAGYVLHSFAYGDKEPWVELADGEGYSLELAGVELDPSIAASWDSSALVGGTPGTWTASVGTSDPWADSSEQSGLNWRHQADYGTYYVAGGNSIYHRYHGWLEVHGDVSSTWWYDYSLGWLYTSSSFYPFMYSLTRQGWLYYLDGSSSPRWFYDYSSLNWNIDAELR